MDKFYNAIVSINNDLNDLKDMTFIELYKDVENEILRDNFTILHGNLVKLFKIMNERLPTNENGNHFWADPSRDLIKIINACLDLKKRLVKSEYDFSIDEYYENTIHQCMVFLSSSGGSQIPGNMEKIELYYSIPIFKLNQSIQITRSEKKIYQTLKLIGSGSYANIFRYKDLFYGEYFVVKKAKKDLNEKELIRFENEYLEMKKYKSPYIVEVFHYDSAKNEYVMEYMDENLYNYITKNNNILKNETKKKICLQICKAFSYIHSKKHLHRDISPKNILLKIYEDTVVVKVADFGLVKIPDSNTTSLNTEVKGYFNDPSLHTEGFSNYNMLHETYALTRLFLFVLTGKTNLENIKEGVLYDMKIRGLNSDKSKRFKNIFELTDMIRTL